jgi:hypothetical protein
MADPLYDTMPSILGKRFLTELVPSRACSRVAPASFVVAHAAALECNAISYLLPYQDGVWHGGARCKLRRIAVMPVILMPCVSLPGSESVGMHAANS